MITLHLKTIKIKGINMNLDTNEILPLLNIEEYDCYVYIGSINMTGYYRLYSEINKHKKKEKILLCLITFGGDPNAGFKIGRVLQDKYPNNVAIYIPNVCKSAGTLTTISANHIIMHDKGELGPLDIQLRKDDELGVSNSGLDIFKTLETLEDRANLAFNKYLRAARFGQGLSTKMSADVATKLVATIINPIAEQIDPIKIGEHQRATDIAIEYGNRLNQISKGLCDTNALDKLIRGYPSHGFVIDLKEAKTIFSCVIPAQKDIIEKFFNLQNVVENHPIFISQELYVEFISEEKTNEPTNQDIKHRKPTTKTTKSQTSKRNTGANDTSATNETSGKTKESSNIK